jgi:hypothetical protein
VSANSPALNWIASGSCLAWPALREELALGMVGWDSLKSENGEWGKR